MNSPSVRLISAAFFIFAVAILILFRLQKTEVIPAPLHIERVDSKVSPDGEALLLTLYGEGFTADTRVNLTPDLGTGLATVARFSPVKRIQSIFLQEQSALIADSNQGFHLVDVADLTRIEILGTLRDGLGYVWDVTRAGHMAFVADVNQGVFGIDVDNPAAMKIVFRLPMPDKTLGVMLHEDCLAVSGGETGVYFFDIRQPEKPQALGFVETPGFAWQTAAAGDRVYVADDRSGVHLIETDSEGGYRIRASCATNSRAVDVEARDGLVYVALAEGEIQVIDWHDPDRPRVSCRLSVAGTCSEVMVATDRLFAAAGQGGIYVFDLSRPERPVELRNYPFSGGVDCMALKESFLIAGVSFGGLEVIDLKSPPLPPAAKRIPASSRSRGLAVLGSKVVVADAGIREFDTKDPGNPTLEFDEPGRSGLCNVAVKDGIVFRATGSNGLQISWLDPAESGRLLGELRPGGMIVDLVLDGSWAYLADGDGSVIVANVEDPAAPYLVTRLPVSGGVADLAQIDDLLYLATTDLGLVVVDVADPSKPEIIFQHYLAHGLRGIKVSGSLVGLFSGNGGIFLLDSSRPRTPRLVTTLRKEGRVSDIAMAQGRLFALENISRKQNMLEVFDLSEPRRPLLTEHRAVGIHVDTLLCADGMLFFNGPEEKVLIFDTQGSGPLREIGQFQGGLSLKPAAWDAPYLYLVCKNERKILTVDVETPTQPRVVVEEKTGFKNFEREVFVSGGHFLIGNANGGALDIYPSGQGLAAGILASVPLLGEILAATIEDNRLYLVEKPGGLRIFSFSPGGEVAELARLPEETMTRRILVRDGIVFLAQQREGLRIIDLRDPARPEILGKMDISWPRQSFASVRDVALMGDLVLAAVDGEGLLVVEVGDLRHPRVVGYLPLKHARQVAVSGRRVFVLAGKNTLWMVDVEDPEHPVVSARIDGWGTIDAFQVLGDRIYLAEGYGGIRILPTPQVFEAVGESGGQRLMLRGPRPEFPGAYKVEVGNGRDLEIVHGAVSVL